MIMITVKMEILVPKPLIRIPFQLARECQSSVVLDLRQDLVDWGSQRGEACEPPSGGFGVPIFTLVPCLSHLSSPILQCIFLPLPLLGLLFSGQ